MDGTTAWYASQTFWGSVIAMVAGAGAAYDGLVKGDQTQTSAGLTAAFGGLFAVIGRFKATKPLGTTTTPSTSEKVAVKVDTAVVAAKVTSKK